MSKGELKKIMSLLLRLRSERPLPLRKVGAFGRRFRQTPYGSSIVKTYTTGDPGKGVTLQGSIPHLPLSPKQAEINGLWIDELLPVSGGIDFILGGKRKSQVPSGKLLQDVKPALQRDVRILKELGIKKVDFVASPTPHAALRRRTPDETARLEDRSSDARLRLFKKLLKELGLASGGI